MHIRSYFELRSFALLVILLCSGFFSAPPVQASTRVSIGVFHEALSPYGNWVNHPTYGQVWYPRNVAQDWRPYTDGYWAYTDEYGWLWVANEPWGWAPFHYGRWAWDDWYGWVWVPGQTWAPAWVFWRSGGGFAAWAPMPPNVVWQPGLGLNISYFNYDRDLRWDSWVSVRDVNLPHRHISRHIIPPSQNRQIINVTNYNQNISLHHNTIVNQGIPVKQIEQITRQPVMPVVPRVHDRLDRASAEHDQSQPNIIRLPIATPTSDELHQNEELARRLDGKRPGGTRAELPVASSEHEPRAPGRLTGAQAPAPYATPEPQNSALALPDGNTLPQAAIPQTPVIGLDSELKHQGRSTQEERKSTPSVLLPSTNRVPIIPDQAQTVTAPVPAAVSSGAAVMPSEQNQPLDSIKQLDAQPFQTPVVTQPQTESPPDQNNKQHKELEFGRDKEVQPPTSAIVPLIPAQSQADGVAAPARQAVSTDAAAMPSSPNQILESAKQPEIQPLQVLPVAPLQTENIQRQQEAAQQSQQQEAVRQQALQNQQQMEAQRQQAEREREAAQQSQQQQAAQQALQNQQQMEVQRQQAEREAAQQMQQQEAARQQAQQMEAQRQQAERARKDAEQKLQVEGANIEPPH